MLNLNQESSFLMLKMKAETERKQTNVVISKALYVRQVVIVS